MALTYIPFGTVAVTDEFKSLFSEHFNYEDQMKPFVLKQSVFPAKHPALQALCTTSSIPEVLPEWWKSYINSRATPEEVRYLLLSATLEEFKAGMLNELRWKSFRTMLLPDDRKKYPQSPKIGGILQALRSVASDPDLAVAFEEKFNDRGSTSLNKNLVATISIDPIDFLFMGNGHGWSSCQDVFSGSYLHCLPPNFFDVGVGIAHIKEADVPIWKRTETETGRYGSTKTGPLEARLTLRVTVSPFDLATPAIVLCRVYGNNRALEHSLIQMCIARILECGYHLGLTARGGHMEYAAGSLSSSAYVTTERMYHSLFPVHFPTALHDERPYLDYFSWSAVAQGLVAPYGEFTFIKRK